MKECENAKKTSHRRSQCGKWFSKYYILNSGFKQDGRRQFVGF